MEAYDTYEHDVLVIGAGGAGLRAAIEASMRASSSMLSRSAAGRAVIGTHMRLAHRDLETHSAKRYY